MVRLKMYWIFVSHKGPPSSNAVSFFVNAVDEEQALECAKQILAYINPEGEFVVNAIKMAEE